MKERRGWSGESSRIVFTSFNLQWWKVILKSLLSRLWFSEEFKNAPTMQNFQINNKCKLFKLTKIVESIKKTKDWKWQSTDPPNGS